MAGFKKWLLWSLAGILLLVMLVFSTVLIVLYYHEDRIASHFVDQLNEGQQGVLKFESVELAPFRAFPYISIDIKGLRFYSDRDPDEAKPLYAFEDVYVGFDVLRLLKGDFTVAQIWLKDGFILFEKLEDGTYKLLKAKSGNGEESENDESSFELDLARIVLDNISFRNVNYGPEGNDMLMDIKHAEAYFRTTGEGISMGLESDIFLNHYMSGYATWFRELPFSLQASMTIKDGVIEILPSKLVVATGNLNLHGTLIPEQDLFIDLKLEGKKKSFDTFISFMPPESIEKLLEFKNEGDIYFNGSIVGALDVSSPVIDLEIGCSNTVFYHEKHDKALRDVAFKGRFRTGDDGGLETAFAEVQNLYGQPESGLIRGTFRVDNFVNPQYQLDFHADFELEDLKTFYDVEEIEYGSGRVTIDVTLDEYVGVDSALHFNTITTNGVMSSIAFRDVEVKLASMSAPLREFNGRIVLDGDDLRSEGLRVKKRNSDFAFDFLLTNVAALLHGSDAPVDLTIHGESKQILMAELVDVMKEIPDEPWARDTLKNLQFDLDVHTKVNALQTAEWVPEMRLNFRHLEFESAKYPFPIGDISGKISLSDNHLNVEKFGITVGRNKLHTDVSVTGLTAFFDSTSTAALEHNIALTSKYFNAKELLVYDGKPMIHDSIEEEVIRDLVFRGSGNIHPHSNNGRGFLSSTHIDHFTVRINDLPAIRDVDGFIETDTTGTIAIRGLQLAMGKSDVRADVYLRNFLDPNQKHNHIEGKVRSNLLDLDDMMGWVPEDTVGVSHEEAFNIFALNFPEMHLETDIREVRHHRSVLNNLHGEVRVNTNHIVQMDTLFFEAAGGSVRMNGRFNGSNPDSIYFRSVLAVDNIDLDQVMYKMDNFGNDFVVNENLQGRMSGTMTVRALMHPDMVPDLRQTHVVADVTISEGRLRNFGPIQALADFMGDKDLENVRFGELSNTFTFDNGALTIPEMKITSTLGYLYLSGNQTIDMDMNYALRLPLGMVKRASWSMVKGKLQRGSKRKEDMDDLEKAEEEIISSHKGLIKGYLNVLISGTPDDYSIGLGRPKERKGGA